MADGEIELQVNADGVEDAAGELDGAAPDVSGGDGGGGGGGLGGGRLLGILGSLVALLSFLEPILDVVQVVSDILTAFVAPLAVLLLRLLSPTLRLLLEALPFFFELVELVSPIADLIASLTSLLLAPVIGILRVATDVLSRINELKDRLLESLTNLPGKIGQAIADRLPGDFSDFRSGLARGLRGDPSGGGSSPGENNGAGIGTLIRISGGLTPFIDEIVQNGNVDLR